MTWHELLSLTPEKKNTVRINVLQRTSIQKPEKLTNYNSEREIFMTCSQFY